jgi:hypothetical protein
MSKHETETQAENMTVEVHGNKLVITVDVSPAAIKTAPMASTGAAKLIASSRGWLEFENEAGQPAALSLAVTSRHGIRPTVRQVRRK